MSTLSVPLTPELEAFIKMQVKSGHASNKADVVRRALTKFSEDEAVRAVLDAAMEPTLRGDLRTLAKTIR